MWGQGPGWRSHQRSVEELVKAETAPGPTGAPPRRPRTSLGAAGVFGFVAVLVLLVLVRDYADGAPDPDEIASPAPTTVSWPAASHPAVAAVMPAGYASGPLATSAPGTWLPWPHHGPPVA